MLCCTLSELLFTTTTWIVADRYLGVVEAKAQATSLLDHHDHELPRVAILGLHASLPGRALFAAEEGLDGGCELC